MGRSRSTGDVEDDAVEPAAAERRIDKWLYFTRAIKTRSLSAQLIAAGKVRVNGTRLDKPSQKVKVGDVVTFTAHQRVRVFRVLETGVRRGPASEAQTLYEDLTPPVLRADGGDDHQATGQRERGSGRPTKRDRRALDRLKDER